MKKILLFMSLFFLTLWVVGVFVLGLKGIVHVFIFLSLLTYIRSLFYVTIEYRQEQDTEF